MKIKVWYHIQDCGDGSVTVDFFRTKEEAKASAEREIETAGYGLCENVDCQILDTDMFAVQGETE